MGWLVAPSEGWVVTHVIETRGLRKVYSDVEALKGVSIRVGEGVVYGLLGPNGAGKTTTIKILSTLVMPTSGEAYVGGYNVVEEPDEVRRLIGLVPQDLTADDEMTGWDNVLIQARLHGLRGEEAVRSTRRVLEFVGLAGDSGRRASTYSGGMRRKLEIAMGLVHDPRIVFMDEPTIGLDVRSRREIWGYVRELRRRGVTILLTTHYMEEAEKLCDRVAIIDEGRIVAEGPPAELKTRIKGDLIIVETPDSEDLAELVRGRLNALQVRVSGDEVVIRVPRAEDSLGDLVGLLNGLVVKNISIVKPSLEEVFLELTGKRIRREEPLDAFRFRAFSRRAR